MAAKQKKLKAAQKVGTDQRPGAVHLAPGPRLLNASDASALPIFAHGRLRGLTASRNTDRQQTEHERIKTAQKTPADQDPRIEGWSSDAQPPGH